MANKKTDWHQALIVAQLHINGTSLRKLASDHGMYPTALSVAIQRPWLKAESIIAKAIGVKPQIIWPSRYEKRTKKANKTREKQDKVSLNQCSHVCNVSMSEGVRHD